MSNFTTNDNLILENNLLRHPGVSSIYLYYLIYLICKYSKILDKNSKDPKPKLANQDQPPPGLALFAVLTNCSCFCCDLLTFLKTYFFENFYQEHSISVSNGLDPDWDRYSMKPKIANPDQSPPGPPLFNCYFDQQ